MSSRIFLHRRRVKKRMIDHQGQVSLVRLVDQVPHLVGRLRERLLDEDMLASLQRHERQLIVALHRGGDGNGIDTRIIRPGRDIRWSC